MKKALLLFLLSSPVLGQNISGGVQQPTASTGGTVTSVALTGSGTLFSATPGAAVTTSGNLNVDSQVLVQAANCVLAGPSTGAAAEPTCRVLVNADFPSGLTFASPIITGAFTAPGLVTLSDLATQATNTVLLNATSGTASPTAQAISSCSAAADALIWTTNTGFGCNASITANLSANISGGALGSAPYQNAANTTLFIGGPTTTGHTFIYAWQPSGSAIAPIALDMGTTPGTNCVQFPCKVANIDTTGLGANVATATLYAVPSSGAGWYQISCYTVVTTAATTSSTLPGCGILWTDKDTSVSAKNTGAATSFPVGPTNAQNTVGSVGINNVNVIAAHVAASTNIQYNTSSYATSGATSMVYAVHLVVEYLGP